MGKNNNFKLIGGLIAGILIGGATVVGANQAIQAIQNTEIKVSLNGQVQEFKDETTGETQYPITYHDRTYLPLRNVAQLSGLKVSYDNSSNTASLSDDYDAFRNKLYDEYIKWSYIDRFTRILSSDNNSYYVWEGGENYGMLFIYDNHGDEVFTPDGYEPSIKFDDNMWIAEYSQYDIPVEGKEETYYKSYYNLKLENGKFTKVFIRTDFEDILERL